MQQNTPEKNYYQEDEIYRKELFKNLWLKKNFILGITATITILASIYAFNKTPIYEATALVEIGNYKSHNNNIKTSLDSTNELVKKLNILYIDIFENEEDRKAEITSISAPRKTNNFIEIKAEAISNEGASTEILKVFSYIEKNHQNKLDRILSDRRSRVKSISRQINTIKNKQLELLSRDSILDEDKALLNSIQLISMINGELGVQSISTLIKEKTNLLLLLNSHNYNNSEIVGQIVTSDYPAKPMKKLIVAVAFISGFILSIFLALIMNAFRSEDDKVTA